MEALTFLLVLIPRGQTIRLPPAAWPLGWAIKENHKTQNHGTTEPGDRAGRWPLTLTSPKRASSLSTLTSHTAPSPCQILAQLADPWKHGAPPECLPSAWHPQATVAEATSIILP